MPADLDRRPSGAEHVLVVTLGKSKGASTVSAGLALAQVGAGRRVLLAELDPAGGDLTERIVFRGRPSAGRDVDVPAGARELADDLEAAELASAPGLEHGIARYLVTVDEIGGLAVLLGDPLVDGARRSAAVVGPRMAALSGDAGFDVVVADGGRWTSADAARLVGVDLVYAVVEATSTSQNHRCLAEMQNLWRQLRATNPGARMVVTILRRRWPARELLDLYQRPPAAAIGEGGRRYRVVVVDLDRGGRQTAVRLAAGRWSEIRVRRLQPFEELARPIGVRRRPAVSDDRRAGPVDEYAYLDVGGGQVQVAPMPAAWPFVDMGIEWADDGDETSAAGDGGSRLASHEGGNATDDVPGPGRGVS